MVRSYLVSLCPNHGLYFYRQFLLQTSLSSDEDTLMIGELLSQSGFQSEKLEIFAIRGKSYLQKCGKRVSSDLRSSPSCFSSPSSSSSTSSSTPSSFSLGYLPSNPENMSKALYFYFLSGNTLIVQLLLESCLYHCMNAVVSCSSIYFQNKLSFLPMPPVLPLRPGEINYETLQEEMKNKTREGEETVVLGGNMNENDSGMMMMEEEKTAGKAEGMKSHSLFSFSELFLVLFFPFLSTASFQ
jgi:hypothetical protein